MRGAWAEVITGTCVLIVAIGFAVVGFQRGGWGSETESYVLNASFRSIEGVAAASLYAACRQCGVPRTLDEIGQASRTGRKEIGRTYRFMVRELKMKIMPTGPEDYISRFCSGLGLDAEVEAKAYELIKAAQEKELTSGRGPTGIAASIIYIASVLCGKRRTQREVAEVAGVTEVTIRNRYKELIQNLNIELDI